MHDRLLNIWYGRSLMRFILWPLSFVYQIIIWLRRFWLLKIRQPYHSSIPVIVVGNISVGGVGKTPLAIALVKALQMKGIRVGVVSRGYKATIKRCPYLVQKTDTAKDVGDEPLLIVRQTGCPLVIGSNRVKAIEYLTKHFNCDLIISDDGLQHYAMGRAMEIAVIDGTRGMGNGFCLPAGPLREKVSRLKAVDFLVANGQYPGAYSMQFEAVQFLRVKDEQIISSQAIEQPIVALAGIGNPLRFFNMLTALGLSFTAYAFKDHHVFAEKDFCFNEKNLIMTEKDAVKCDAFAKDSWYFLRIQAILESAFWQAFWSHPLMQSVSGTRKLDEAQ